MEQGMAAFKQPKTNATSSTSPTGYGHAVGGQTGQSLPPTYAEDVRGAGHHGDKTHLATGVAAGGQGYSHGQNSPGLGAPNPVGGANEGYASENPGVGGFVHPGSSYQTGGSETGGGVGGSEYPDRNASGVPGAAQTTYQGQQAVHGGTDATYGAPPAHHHRDDAVTNLNAQPGEQHGAGQLSTTSDNRIPEYDRNAGFNAQQGGGLDQSLGQGQRN